MAPAQLVVFIEKQAGECMTPSPSEERNWSQKGHANGAPFLKILYLTDLAQKVLSLRRDSYLCTHLAVSAQR